MVATFQWGDRVILLVHFALAKNRGACYTPALSEPKHLELDFSDFSFARAARGG